MTVGIIDYGVGNIGSLLNMFYRLEVEAAVITTPEEVAHHDKVLLPGVGAFDAAARELQRTGFDEAVTAHARAGNHLMGICLGMQLLLDSSEEGSLPGLGLVQGTSRRFDVSSGIRVPHMGWAQIQPAQEHRVLKGLPNDHRFYFAHSYRVHCDEPSDVLASSRHGETYTSMIARGSVIGAQFHPEKSHKFGMQLLKNWTEL